MKRNRGWIWFFLILAGLAVAAMVTMIVYNLGLQLRPEKLAEARLLWKEKGPKSYQLTYTTRVGVDRTPTTFVVRVRKGEVVSSTVNDRPESKQQFASRDMNALFGFIDRFLQLDSQRGKPRTYARAVFDPQTGALRWYVRRVMGGTERVEIEVDALETLEDE